MILKYNRVLGFIFVIIGKMHIKKRIENGAENKEWGAAIRTAWSSGATLAPGGKIFEN